MNTASKLTPWLLFSLVVALPFLAWAQNLDWELVSLSLYALFPLLGLWAWGIMWTHYFYGALFLAFSYLERNPLYTKISGYIVLMLILFHPGLLALAQWQATALLPLSSFYAYAGSSLKFYIIIGGVALTTFLAYELLVRLRQQPCVRRLWPWVSLSQMIAMTLIFIHGLQLGQHLQAGWLQIYWIILGVLLIPSFAMVGWMDWSRRHQG